MRDKIIISFFIVTSVTALVFWLGALYVVSTVTVPQAGGEYTEGIVAQPRYINPILSQTSDADADLVELIYSGLFSYDADGNLINRLAEDYSVSSDGKVYTIHIRQGVKWHDGEELTADDVVYTIRSIQNPAYKSPLRSNWLSVETDAPEKYTVTFTLQKSYSRFLNNLTVGILPKHIWKNIAQESFFLADYNLAPVGSGPYIFFNSEKDSSGNILSYELRAWKEYFDGAPYISKIVFHFYPDEQTLIDAYNKKEVLGINSLVPENISKLKARKSTRIYDINTPRVFSVFFNPTTSVPLANDEVREALSYAIDRETIVREVLSGKGQPAFGPLLSFMSGYTPDFALPSFDQERANALFDEHGWTRGTDGIRSKGGVALEFSLAVPEWPELVKTADILKSGWEQIGARVTVNIVNTADLQQNIIRPRQYDALLFGEASSVASDPYPFWHSSQKRDPGLNLALLDNKDVDDVLVSLREELDGEKQKEQYRKFQELLLREKPAIFLYSPTYLYLVSSVVQGIDIHTMDTSHFRLSNVKNWYIKTDRVKK
ncbi:MAG: ABC transporter substrate-binding protein [Candidatus Moranbacteria bacterium]|nr:ABC transporter substrate-binding protein [Candidatus Moranbacteria bacterium]MDD3965261.1 ABC transporter substrate-binding protein [Candidatus Moranbacteria bacterium]